MLAEPAGEKPRRVRRTLPPCANFKNEGYPVHDEDVARLSRTMRPHINMLGRHSFALPEAVARGELRPLRDPRQTMRRR